MTIRRVGLALWVSMLGSGTAIAEWYDHDFDTNVETCRPFHRPNWCDQWFAAIDASRPRVLDLSLPEWNRLTFRRSLTLCSAVDLQPDWCNDWYAAMAGVAAEEAYSQRAADRKAEVEAAEAERKARIAAWRAVIARVRTRTMTKDDVAEVRKRADAGDAEALELLGWMHTRGYGVDMDFVRAYEFYGRAVLAGRPQAKPNLDRIWPYLNGAEKQQVIERFEDNATPQP